MISIIAGICQVIAWHFPGTIFSAILAIISLPLLANTIIKKSYLQNYLFYIICYSLGFYWLISTFQRFAGLNLIASIFLFILFCSISSITGILIKFFYERSKNKYISLLGFIISSIQTLPIIIFPWSIIHPLLPLNISMIANIGGTGIIIIILMNCIESIYQKRKIESVFYLTLIIISSFYSRNGIETKPLKIAVIQANITTERKRNLEYFKDNLQEYVNLTNQVNNTDLLIWSESSFNKVLDYNDPVLYDQELGILNFKYPLLTGYLSYNQENDKYYNSISIFSKQKFNKYHKRILMPFGEYTPFAKYFPFLLKLNPTAAQFESGKSQEVFNFKNNKIAPLICYEDLIPELASEAVFSNSADILMSFSNDAWFGDTIANKQHNLIASYRAIENNRFLVRSTNSGLTAIINNKGQAIKELPTFQSGILETEILGYSDLTFYTKLVSVLNLTYLAWGFLIIILLRCLL